MMYVRSKLFKSQLIIQALLLSLYLLADWSQTAEVVVAGLLLCSVGIPHGANDYLYRKKRGRRGLLLFTLSYLGVMGLYALIWWFLPLVALAIFFAISFHHFGQSNFENERWSYPPSLLWGAWLLLLPVVIHWQEALGIFMQMTQTGEVDAVAAPTQSKFWQYASVAVIGAANLIALWIYERRSILPYTLQLILIGIWYLSTPLLFGFVVVFSLWHSMQSLQHQIQHQKAEHGWTSGRFVIAMLPFGVAALAGFGLYMWWRGFQLAEAFILLSLITLPHVLIMHKLYEADDKLVDAHKHA